MEVINMENKNLFTVKGPQALLIVGIIALLIGGAAGFFGGMQYQKGKVTANTQAGLNGNFQRGNRTRAGRPGGANGMAVRGQIISADNNSITVKMMDGSTKIVILGSNSVIAKTTTASASDLVNGANVIVFGTTNSDGSVTAQNVQIGNGMMFGGPRPSSSPSTNPQ
jgi:hypothetical protein